MKRAHRGRAQIIRGMRMRTVAAVAMPSAMRVPFWARFQFPAPTFCPTKVVAETERDTMGRMAKASIF